MSANKQLLKNVSEQFAKGNMEFVEPHLADDVQVKHSWKWYSRR